MAETEDIGVQDPQSQDQSSDKGEKTKSLQAIALEGWVPGQYAPFDYSNDEFAELTDEQKNKLREMVILVSRRDVAARRFEVEQCWEERLFDRGYQHLLPRRGGGWNLPGEKSIWSPLQAADSAALYSTNIIGRDRDVLTAAIAREVPKVNFFPKKPEDPASMRAADAANNYKYIWEKVSCLRDKLMELAHLFCSDARVLLYTRHVRDAKAFGYEEDGTTPRGAELTDLFGKLEHKVPMQAKSIKGMDAISTFEELDIAVARAKYSWVAEKIKPGTPGIGEIELDMIARVNTRLALLGSYVTGDAMQRDVTEQMTWFRPSAFFDEIVTKTQREEFLKLFPDGCLVVYCGQEFCFARNEDMDDHLTLAHALPGIGQNRRSLLSSVIPIQKRLNAWIDLMDAFFRRTVPRRHYDADAFDIEALQAQDNVPGKSTPFVRQPGITVDQLCWIEPTPTHQPQMPDFIQSFFGTVPASLDGASDGLFQASSEDDGGPTPVGTVKIRRDQALARAGLAWNSAKGAFAEAARQAVTAAAECRNGTISMQVGEGNTGDGMVSVNADDLKGGVLCYPEYDASFPESSAERETRYMGIAAGAAQSPFYASMIKIPRNLRVIADNARMSELQVPGEQAVKKQLFEIEKMLKAAPNPNPQYAEIADQAAEMQASGQQVPPEVAQQIEQLPKQISSIDVAKDGSEDHETEALTCFEWMNDPDAGQKYKTGTEEQQAGFQNVYLHWQAHQEMVKKLTQQATPIPPIVRIGMKDLPPAGRTQAAAKAGVMVPPQEFEKKDQIDMQRDIHKKVVPKVVPQTYRKIGR